MEQCHTKAFTLVEVVVVTALILVVSLAGFQTAEIVSQRNKEEQLKKALLEMRAALDKYHQDKLQFPNTFNDLLTEKPAEGGFYLRRFPINPMLAEVKWEIASKTSLTGIDDKWIEATNKDVSILGGPIVDVRCPPLTTGGTGLNGIAYENW